MKEYMNVSEAAREFGISRGTIYNWSRQGKLTVYKPSPRMSRVKVADIKRLIEKERLYNGKGD